MMVVMLFAVVAAAVTVLTVVATHILDLIWRRGATGVKVVVCGFVAPCLLLAAASHFGRPDPRSVDGPAMVMLLLLFLALASLPLSFVISVVTIRLRRRLCSRNRLGR